MKLSLRVLPGMIFSRAVFPVAMFPVAMFLVAMFIAAFAPRLVSACDVCYGAADSPWIDASRASVLLLLGVTGSVQVGFVAFFLYLRKRMKTYAAECAAESIEGIGDA